jgi:hypothetical protein
MTQKLNLSWTFRRIGEELYKSLSKDKINKQVAIKSKIIDNQANKDASSEATSNSYKQTQNENFIMKNNSLQTTLNQKSFLQSENPQIRILAGLIIIRTLSQGSIFLIYIF